jgi:hypothetical protein
MNINLKDFNKDIDVLKHASRLLSEESETKGISRKVDKIIRFLQEIETDLELGGESIVELDKPRLEAIEERNNSMRFKKDNYE